MKTTMKTMLALLALGASVLAVGAQDDYPPQGGDGQNGPPPRGHHPPPLPIVQALDVNHDGVIDADEIANASAELKTLDKNGDGIIDAGEIANASTELKSLDKNGDGQLTRDEFCPPRPRGQDGPNGQGSSFGGGDNMPPGPPPGDQ